MFGRSNSLLVEAVNPVIRQALDAADELKQLNIREREIFEALVKGGVKDDDPDLNPVHRSLLEWYRLDLKQQDIERELGM